MASLKYIASLTSHIRKTIRGRGKKSVTLGLTAGLLVFSSYIVYGQYQSTYHSSDQWRTYIGNIAFSYPSSWSIRGCGESGAFIELPGKIPGHFKSVDKLDGLKISGSTGGNGCEPDNKITFDYFPSDEFMTADCQKFNTGEKLSNDLFLDAKEHSDFPGEVWLVTIKQDTCYYQNQSIISFSFDDPSIAPSGEKILQYGGEPRVNKQKFLDSPQYRDIRRFAESIRTANG
jgi:hypothetical protein